MMINDNHFRNTLNILNNSNLFILIEDYMKKAKQEDSKRPEQDYTYHEDKSEPKLKRNPHFGKMFTPCV